MNNLILQSFVKEAFLGKGEPKWVVVCNLCQAEWPSDLTAQLKEVVWATKQCGPAPAMVCASLHVGEWAVVLLLASETASPNPDSRQSPWGALSLHFLTSASCVWKAGQARWGEA